MTFKEVQDEVLNHGLGEMKRPRVKNWINEAQAAIAREVTLRDLLTSTSVPTVAGTATVSLPSDVARVASLVIQASGDAVYFEPRYDWLLRDNEGGTVRGKPELYSLKDKTATLLLSPVPDGVYTLTLTYYQAPTDLSADADVSPIPLAYHHLLTSYAVSRALRGELRFDLANAAMNDYLTGLRRLQADRQHEVSDAPVQVAGTWSDY